MSDFLVKRLRLTHYMDGRELGMTEQRAEAADEIERLHLVVRILWSASLHGHLEHWDHTMQHGVGCEACLRAQRLRDLAASRLGYRPEMIYEESPPTEHEGDTGAEDFGG